MPVQYRRSLLFLLIFSLLATSVVAAYEPIITLDVTDATLDVGETTTVAMVIDALPSGLSGYNITATLTDPSVAEIIGVFYPEWAKMPVNGSLPADTLYAQAVDLMDSVGAGATNLTICTLTVRADAAGEVNLSITATKIDDDIGGRYFPETADARLCVENIPKMEANFIANVTSGIVPMMVQLTDTSSGTPTNWSWTFGDNTTSTAQHPVHTYTVAGTYTVSLSVDEGADTCTLNDYIKVTPVLFGDANDDENVNQADTLRVLKEVVGLATAPSPETDLFTKTDVHTNGVIEVGDAMFIAQYNVGLRDAWFALRI